MSDSNRSDHWDLLASALGAEPRKSEPIEPTAQIEEKTPVIEDEALDSDVETMSESRHKEPPVASAEPSPVQRISSWDALAMELGIEVKPEPPPPPAPTHIPAARHVEKKAVIPAAEPLKPRESRKDEIAEFGKNIEPFKKYTTPSDDESDEQGERKSRHRRGRRHRGKDKVRSDDDVNRPSSATSLDTPSDDDLIDLSLDIADKVIAEKEQGSREDESGKQHPKHRRSRRGSRKRKQPDGEIAREKSMDRKTGDFAVHAETVAGNELSQVSGDEEDILDDQEDGGQRGGKAAIRAIPTWEESVGFIVTKNMESRPRRQGSGPPRSRSGGPSHKRRRK